MTDSAVPYSKNNPFHATIKERYSLCKPGSSKNTEHVVLDIKGSGLTYQVGDCIGIFPINDPDLIRRTLFAMKATGEEVVVARHTGIAFPLWDFFEKQANITDISRKLVSEIAARQTNASKKERLEHLAKEDQNEAFKKYLNSHELWDILMENEEVSIPHQELCNLLMPMLPRLYSIASSMKAVGDEVHLTIALVHYDTNGIRRKGVCTHYLCELAPLHQPVVPIYLQPNHGFTLPKTSNIPIIMVGPGTGVAPFRAFMQERIAMNDEGGNWLFFGERNRAYDFLYHDYLTSIADQNRLRLDLAFSRDQEHKLYVQDRMRKQGKDLFEWLQKGAVFFVCGDAKHMAKDVDAALHSIVREHGKLDEQATKQYIKNLRSEKRYLRDVY